MCVALQRSAKQPPANKPASARLAFIRDLHEQGASTSTLSKLRLVGRVLSVDETSSTVLLEHEGYSVLVDLSLCLANGEQDAFRYLPRLRTVLSVMGHVEPNLDESGDQPKFPSPILTLPHPSPKYVPSLYISAVLMEDKTGMDLNMWKEAVETTKARLQEAV